MFQQLWMQQITAAAAATASNNPLHRQNRQQPRPASNDTEEIVLDGPAITQEVIGLMIIAVKACEDKQD